MGRDHRLADPARKARGVSAFFDALEAKARAVVTPEDAQDALDRLCLVYGIAL